LFSESTGHPTHSSADDRAGRNDLTYAPDVINEVRLVPPIGVNESGLLEGNRTVVAETEGALSFTFLENVPAHVLAAFSGLVRTERKEPSWPSFPAPVQEIDDLWEAMYEDMVGVPDPHAHEPWVHNWAPWVDDEVGVDGGPPVPAPGLRWNGTRWTLDCTFIWTGDYEIARRALTWLVPYIKTLSDEQEIGWLAYEEEFGLVRSLRVVDGELVALQRTA
jgi:hypothetical protein